MTRTFISIDIPETVKSQIRKIQEAIPEFKGKLTELENLHLTLKFLGEISEDRLRIVREKLKELKFKKFETEIDSIGVFSEKFVRIVWLHLSNCDELQKRIDERLFEVGFEKENRFMSHLTIARIKNIKNKKEFLDKISKIRIPKINFQADNFRLKESILTEKGPIYETIEEYILN